METPILAAPLAVACSIVGMQATRTLHPPAGGTTLIAVLGSERLHELSFGLLLPTGSSAAILVLIALGNNFVGRRYPTYWW
jgi:CBS-domain-containing membrane protein